MVKENLENFIKISGIKKKEFFKSLKKIFLKIFKVKFNKKKINQKNNILRMTLQIPNKKPSVLKNSTQIPIHNTHIDRSAVPQDKDLWLSSARVGISLGRAGRGCFSPEAGFAVSTRV